MKQYDIRAEATRTITFAGGWSYTIHNPVTLYIRDGGKTHRVLDAEGVVHCYVAPEYGNSVLSWVPRDPSTPVQF